jgi:hypothetical protein
MSGDVLKLLRLVFRDLRGNLSRNDRFRSELCGRLFRSDDRLGYRQGFTWPYPRHPVRPKSTCFIGILTF